MGRKLALVILSCVGLSCGSKSSGNPFGNQPAAQTGSVTATLAPMGTSNVETTAFTATFFNGSVDASAAGTPGGIDTTLLSSTTTQGPPQTTRILDIELFGTPTTGAVFTVDTTQHSVMGCTVSYEEQQLDSSMKLVQDPTWASSSGTITIDAVSGSAVTFHGDVIVGPGFSPSGGALGGPAATGQVDITITGRFDDVQGM